MHRTYMWGIEQGRQNPSVRHLTRIAEALAIDLAALFDGCFTDRRLRRVATTLEHRVGSSYPGFVQTGVR